MKPISLRINKCYETYQLYHKHHNVCYFSTTFSVNDSVFGLQSKNWYQELEISPCYYFGKLLPDHFEKWPSTDRSFLRRFLFYGHFRVWGCVSSSDLQAVYGLSDSKRLRKLTSRITSLNNNGVATKKANKRWHATPALQNHYDAFPSSKQGMSRFNYEAVRKRGYKIKELGFDAPLEQLISD